MAWQNNMQQLYTQDDLDTATQEAANGAIQQAKPAIEQSAVQQALSPDNVRKKVGLYRQSVADSLLNVGAQ